MNVLPILGGNRPTCEETQQRLLSETMSRGNLSMCTVNDVPGTYSYFQVCTSALCIPQIFCEDPELWVIYENIMLKYWAERVVMKVGFSDKNSTTLIVCFVNYSIEKNREIINEHSNKKSTW